MQIDELRLQLKEANDGSHNILAKAGAEKRDLTTEEEAELDGLLAASERIHANIERLERLGEQTERLNQSQGRKTAPDQPQLQQRANDDAAAETPEPRRQLSQSPPTRQPRITVLDPIQRGNGGFRSLGDMAYHVRRACLHGGMVDPRLERLASATTYGNESSGPDGGFAIPPDFRSAIMTTILAENQLLPRCDQVNVTGNQFTCPVDETTPWQSTGGIQAYWEGETSAATQSKIALNERSTKLWKLRALVPMTEELLEDASGMDSYLRVKAPQKIAFKVNWALLNGTGAGMPLGVLNAGNPSLVTVAKESGQVASTIVGNNILKMYNRMYSECRGNAVWVYNQDCEPQLFKLSLPGTDNTGNAVTGWGTMLFIPPGGLNNLPYATIMGRPALTSQACPALSSAGDLSFIDFSQYLALLKSGPNPKVETSIHLWFDQDLIAFKFILRLGGVPWWSTTMAALNGSNTYSPYVALGAR